MRSVVVFALLAVAAPSAIACPRGVRCLTSERAMAGARIAASEPAPPRWLDLAVPATALRPRSPWTFDDPPREVPDPEVPAIWRDVEQRLSDPMPRVEHGGLSFSIAPVIVEGAFDAVPGVGVAGEF